MHLEHPIKNRPKAAWFATHPIFMGCIFLLVNDLMAIHHSEVAMSNNQHLDAVAGSQLAMIVAVKLLLSAYKGNPQAIAAMASELEEMRANLLSSSASDYKLQAFEEAAQSLLDTLS